MTKHNIILQPSGSRGQVEEGQSIRSAARDLGVEIESICAENATCGKCMVLNRRRSLRKIQHGFKA